MKFWKLNRLDMEYDVPASVVRDAYLLSEQCTHWQEGAQFDRGLSIFLTDIYGSYEHEDFQKLGDFIYTTWKDRLKAQAVLRILQVTP